MNFVSIVAPTAAVGAISPDGTALPAESYTPIGASGFAGVQVAISPGSHSLTGPLPFGVLVYGFAQFDSYGYPGGMSLAPIAIVARLDLTPEAATNSGGILHCVTATVSDQEDNPVGGVRVDFNVSGVNPTARFVAAAEDGRAESCYLGTALGMDTIVAAVGAVPDTATKAWIAPVSRFNDGINALTLDDDTSEFTLIYVVDGITLHCSGSGARIDEGLLTMTSRCTEDFRDTLRAVGPADATVTVQLIDQSETAAGGPVIRQFLLTREPAGAR
jgi:hypothetical protein